MSIQMIILSCKAVFHFFILGVLTYRFHKFLIEIAMAVSRELYSVKDVKAKVEVDLISKDLAKTEVDDKDFYVCVNRNVESKFIKADESSEDKIDQFIVKHHETITVVQGNIIYFYFQKDQIL